MIIQNPIRRISELVARDPVRLVPELDARLPRRKGKKVTNLGAIAKPDILRILRELEALV